MEQISNMEQIQLEELEEINGGVAPLLIVAGKVIAAGAAGFVSGYTYKKVSNWLHNN